MSKLWDWILWCWWRVKEWPYHLKCRFFYQYYKINIRSLPKYNWLELDDKMVHGLMELVREYVEDHGSGTIKHIQEGWSKDDYIASGCNPDEENYGVDEMLSNQWNDEKIVYDIYLWWKEDYPRLVQSVDDLYDEMPDLKHHFEKRGVIYRWISDNTEDEESLKNLYYHLIFDCEAALEDMLTEKLCTIIKLRKGMWT